MDKEKITTFTTPILVFLLVVAAFLVGMFWTRIRDLEKGKTPEKIAQASPSPEAVLGEELSETIGKFLVTKDEPCLENNKPIVYLFGRSTCPHCSWEHPIFKKVTAKFTDGIFVHDNIDNQSADQEIWDKYSQINQGAIPFIVLGCRYVRLGSGEVTGEQAEEQALTALICKLTDSQPEGVCKEVSDLIEQIE